MTLISGKKKTIPELAFNLTFPWKDVHFSAGLGLKQEVITVSNELSGKFSGIVTVFSATRLATLQKFVLRRTEVTFCKILDTISFIGGGGMSTFSLFLSGTWLLTCAAVTAALSLYPQMDQRGNT